ncbi:MAG: hypothetical protein A2048_10760 [Deltaproteobacteria bacterium GWA2_45_12]|nr:MAG: hypothetical protein A2048_10760 [Deltaproteobacteria bacterium GWA2_45_12]
MHLPILFFSADPSQEKICVNTLKAAGFVRKPYDYSVLILHWFFSFGLQPLFFGKYHAKKR